MLPWILPRRHHVFVRVRRRQEPGTSKASAVVFTPRSDIKVVRLRLDPWISQRVESAMCLLGTFVVFLSENKEFRCTQISSVFLGANLCRNYFVECARAFR